jgi:hypothetical protein
VLLHGDTWGFFHPWLDHFGKSAFEESDPASNESQKKLQLYHDFLAVLLQEVKYAATNKPVMMINIGGVWQKRRLHIHVLVIMGDQKSQDYMCGRKSINSGKKSPLLLHDFWPASLLPTWLPVAVLPTLMLSVS